MPKVKSTDQKLPDPKSKKRKSWSFSDDEHDPDDGDRDSDGDNNDEGHVSTLYSGFVDIPQCSTKPFDGKNKGGAPKRALLDQLTHCYRDGDLENKEGYHCVGEGCPTWFAKHSQKHVAKYCKDCPRVDMDLCASAAVFCEGNALMCSVTGSVQMKLVSRLSI